MWKIFLSGSSTRNREVDWQERLKKEFEGKFKFIRSGEINLEGVVSESVSLDSFLPLSSKDAVIFGLYGIDNADIVVGNISTLSLEVFLQLLYSNLARKPILLFAEDKVSSKDPAFASFITDSFFQSYQELASYLQALTVLPRVQGSQLRDISFMCAQKEITNLFEKEDRKDALFRAAILATQIGQLLHYLTHDRQINPAARSVGSRADEEAQLGDCLIQLTMYCISRHFSLADVYSMGVRRMEENVWRSRQLEVTPRELRPKEIGYGISASVGSSTGRVLIVRTPEDASKISDAKCIVVVPEYTKPVWDEITARIENVIGLISGTGSPNSHPAIVCRELKKPCIVSAKALVDQLKDNEIVTMSVGVELDDNSVTRDSQQ